MTDEYHVPQVEFVDDVQNVGRVARQRGIFRRVPCSRVRRAGPDQVDEDEPKIRLQAVDDEIGLNHSYLFCELHYAMVDGFGAKDKMNLSDLTFNAGLMFEF